MRPDFAAMAHELLDSWWRVDRTGDNGPDELWPDPDELAEKFKQAYEQGKRDAEPKKRKPCRCCKRASCTCNGGCGPGGGCRDRMENF